ncbi:MAG: hypothetical protein U0835_15305 [Isosphaeraceae bacterium]
MGFGSLALGSILSETMARANTAGAAVAPASGVNPLAPWPPQFPGKAKRPSFACSPNGVRRTSTRSTRSRSSRSTTGSRGPLREPADRERATGAAFRSPFAFKKYGQSGLEVRRDLFTSASWPTTSA